MEIGQLVASYTVLLLEAAIVALAGALIVCAALRALFGNSNLARSVPISPRGVMLAALALAAVTALYVVTSLSFDMPRVMALRGGMGNTRAVLFVHGWHGSVRTWDKVVRLSKGDPVFAQLNLYALVYPVLPAHRVDALEAASNEIRRWVIANQKYDDISIVAHSVGGVVARSAAIDSQDRMRPIRLILSFGSPLAGSDFARGATNLIGLPPDVLGKLHPGSDFLTSLSRRWITFKQTVRRAQHACVASTGDLVVTTESATHLCDRHLITIINGIRHQDLVRPLDRSDERYQLIRKYIFD